MASFDWAAAQRYEELKYPDLCSHLIYMLTKHTLQYEDDVCGCGCVKVLLTLSTRELILFYSAVCVRVQHHVLPRSADGLEEKSDRIVNGPARHSLDSTRRRGRICPNRRPRILCSK